MSVDKPATEISKVEIEQQLRLMNDEWVKALVRATVPHLIGYC